MSEESQFRTVLRGFDPDQVKSALDEMHTSVVTARRLAADRTIELTRMQDHTTRSSGDLDEAIRADRRAGVSRHRQNAPSAGDVGARIGSILALANEEAEELRAAGATGATQRGRGRRVGRHRRIPIRAERYADQVRLNAPRRRRPGGRRGPSRAAALLDEANRDADARRAEAQAIVDSHRAQADAVAAFSGQIAKHTDRLQQASTRVEQLAQEEATLVQRQVTGEHRTDPARHREPARRRRRPPSEHQRAADHGRRAAPASWAAPSAGRRRRAGPVDAFRDAAAERGDDAQGSVVVEATEQAFDRGDDRE